MNYNNYIIVEYFPDYSFFYARENKKNTFRINYCPLLLWGYNYFVNCFYSYFECTVALYEQTTQKLLTKDVKKIIIDHCVYNIHKSFSFKNSQYFSAPSHSKLCTVVLYSMTTRPSVHNFVHNFKKTLLKIRVVTIFFAKLLKNLDITLLKSKMSSTLSANYESERLYLNSIARMWP